MSQRRTPAPNGNDLDGVRLARMKRMRWYLVVAVLLVSTDFTLVSIAMLSPQPQTAEAAAVEFVPLLETGAVNAELQSVVTATHEELLGDAPSAVPAGPPAEIQTDTDSPTSENAPTAITRPSNGSPELPPVRSHVTERLGAEKLGNCLHPAVWPAHLALSHGIGVWQSIASTAARIRDESPLLAWSEALAPAYSESPPEGVRVSPERETAVAQDPPRPPAVAPPCLVLRNAPESGFAVHFLANEKVHSLPPGEAIELTGQDRWLIRFHRGGGLGDAAYSLWPGHYEFVVTRRGWDVVRQER